MNTNSLIVILEDSSVDAELIERELREINIPFILKLVDGKEEFLNALTEVEPLLVGSPEKVSPLNART